MSTVLQVITAVITAAAILIICSLLRRLAGNSVIRRLKRHASNKDDEALVALEGAPEPKHAALAAHPAHLDGLGPRHARDASERSASMAAARLRRVGYQITGGSPPSSRQRRSWSRYCTM